MGCIFFIFFRGLTCVYRHQAGKTPSTQQQQPQNYNNNQHWLDDAQPSNFCAYYDAASLYPASGTYFTHPSLLSLSILDRGARALPGTPFLKKRAGDRREGGWEKTIIFFVIFFSTQQ